MGKPKEPRPAKLFMSLIASDEDVFDRGITDLGKEFGEIDFVSDRFSFDFTDYYAKEMGSPLFRHFITFRNCVAMDHLPEVKLLTNHLEEKHTTSQGDRRINMDPGYLCLGHIILGTTKGYSHRPYLRNGIYADLTLIYRDSSFHPLEWTYPDYGKTEVIGLFNEVRRRYLDDLRRSDRLL